MDWIRIEGVPPHDGRYEFDLGGSGFTTREWGWIKKHAGYLPLTIQAGLDGGDAELFTVFAVIALRRAGKIEAAEVTQLYERIAEGEFGSTVVLESDEQEAGEAPPPFTSASSSSNGASSGDAGKTSSETSTPTPQTTGAPASGSSVSVPA